MTVDYKTETRKNLVTCKPTEFLRQTNRIRKSVEKWMKAVNFTEIRNRKVSGLEVITADMMKDESRKDEVAEIRVRNAKKIADQSRTNMYDIVVAAMETCPDETLELLALACFVEPDHVDDHKVSFYLNNLSDILSDKDVLGFFTSLAQLGQTGILNA